VRRHAGLGALLLMLLVAAASPAAAQDSGEKPVLLLADEVSYDAQLHVVTAEGHVDVSRGDQHLLADVLRYYQDTDRIEAEGHVTLLEPGGETLFADKVTLSGDLKNGVAEQLRGRLDDRARLAASQGRLIEGTRTEFDRVVYSPCPLCAGSSSPPLWQIKARQIVHDREAHEIRYHDAFFELYGVPIAYTPYFFHPDPTVERKSGFLAPSVGSNNELGLLLKTPYYFALAPNYDVTLAPIFMTKENPVLTAEYRHLLPSGRFQWSGSGTYATKAASDSNPNPNGQTFRGNIEGDGRFDLGNRWGWGFDVAATTDDTYLNRYGFSNQNVLTNRLFTEKIWDRNYAAINAYGFQGLRPNDDQGLIPIAMPLAEADLVSRPWHWGSRFTFDSSLLALTRTEGLDTRRLSTTGGWTLPWATELGDQYRLSLSLRSDLYQTDGDTQTFENDGSDATGRVIPRATLDWSWPWIGEAGDLFTPLLEPVASLTAAPTNLNSNKIPNEDSQDFEFDDTNLFKADRFPGLDKAEDGGKVSYGLRYSGYGNRGELFSGLFGQSYRFFGDQTFPENSGVGEHFSNYVGRIDLTPDPLLDVRYRFSLDQSSLALTSSELGAELGRRPVRFNVDYLSLESDPNAEAPTKRKEITAGLRLDLLSSISLNAEFRRNLEEERNIYEKFGLVYRHPCVKVTAGVVHKNTSDRDAGSGTTFWLRVTLQTLGEENTESGLLGPLPGG
jgi:LPS-assembly protein